MFQTLGQIHRMLRPEGRAFLSFASLLTPGTHRAAGPDSTTRGMGAIFQAVKVHCRGLLLYVVSSLSSQALVVSPEIVDELLRKTGFSIVERAKEDPSNVYLNRDYLLVLQKL